MEMQLLTYWLTRESTLITVVGPLALCAAGALRLALSHNEASLRMTGKLMLIALLCMPLAHATSFWRSEGLHILPITLLPFAYLVVTRQLDLRTHGLAVGVATWVSALVPDVIGALLAFFPLPTWYWGVGHFGFDDGLFVGPVICTIAMLFIQVSLERRWLRAQTWGLGGNRGAV